MSGTAFPVKNAWAQNCTIQNTFPNNNLYPTSHFGASRSGGARWHAGADFFYPTDPPTRVSIPEGCQIRLYQDGTVIWKSDPTGYGQYMFVDCNPGGVPITLRYAHIAQYITSTAQIEQGRTGIETASIPSHYHFEVLISQTPGKGTPVDPECVLGIDKGDGGPKSPIAECNKCPTQPGPVNFCTDSNAISALINHSQKCYKGNDKNNPGGSTVDPDRLRGVDNQGDPGSTPGPDDGEADPGSIYDNDHTYTDPSDSDVFTGDVDVIYPPTPEDPPIVDPPEDNPGTPGGDPDLTPPPAEGNEPEEMTGCATDTWTAMVNQSVMEARREDILNKRFIVKDVSVLQYSCFNKDLEKIVSDVGPIFSGSDHWANLRVDLIGKIVFVKIYEKDSKPEQPYRIDLLQPTTLEESLSLLVDDAYVNYINGQFNHDVLSETVEVPGAPRDLCYDMGDIWKAAKCKHFDGTDVFYTFEDLKTVEPREFPPEMDCTGGSGA